MLTRYKSPTLNTRLKKEAVFNLYLKQILKVIAAAIIIINILVVLFNYSLMIIGNW
ncbi:MAG TPA: hypothetical protein VIM29_09720 [Bacillota bacterium]